MLKIVKVWIDTKPNPKVRSWIKRKSFNPKKGSYFFHFGKVYLVSNILIKEKNIIVLQELKTLGNIEE